MAVVGSGVTVVGWGVEVVGSGGVVSVGVVAVEGGDVVPVSGVVSGTVVDGCDDGTVAVVTAGVVVFTIRYSQTK